MTTACRHDHCYWLGRKASIQTNKQTNISDLFEPSRETEDRAENAVSPTNKILVKNFPSNVDEDVLETFFESKKKSGGGPVRNVQLNQEKKWALIEFCEAEGMVFIFEPVREKTNNLGSDQVRHKPCLTVTE